MANPLRAKIIVLPTVEEQRAAGDDFIIDPEVVRTPDTPTVLWRGLNYRVPEDVLGRVTDFWLEDGRLWAEIEVPEMQVNSAFLGSPPTLVSAGLGNHPKEARRG